ncbi:MAG: hypothetical protein ABSF26_15635 [Thermoguttaceae bacterium]
MVGAADLFDRGSTFTLQGGSLFTNWIAAPAISRSTSSGLLLSPQSNLWLPRIHRSPGCVIASSGGSGTSSGSVRPSFTPGSNIFANSSLEKPSRSRSKFIHLRVQHPLQGGFHHQPHQPIEVPSRPGLGGDLVCELFGPRA